VVISNVIKVNLHHRRCGGTAELLITAGGENVSPVAIEDAVKEQLPCVSNCMLIGDSRKFLSMLLTLKVSLVLASSKLIKRY